MLEILALVSGGTKSLSRQRVGFLALLILELKWGAGSNFNERWALLLRHQLGSKASFLYGGHS